MDVDWNAELVDQLEWHWQQQLRPRLNGLYLRTDGGPVGAGG